MSPSSSRTNAPAKCHYFFKIILSDIVSDSKMMIPKVFVRKYGNDLADHVLLKTPDGASWQVQLERTEGEVWLHNGWPEFAKYYSICFGHVLVFRYEGGSNFDVIIFDKSASEVEYPMSDLCDEEANLARGFHEGKEIHRMEDYNVSKEIGSPRPCSEMEKSPVTDSCPYKKTRANSICKDAMPSGGCCVQKVHESGHASETKRTKIKHAELLDNISYQNEHFSEVKDNIIPHNRMKPLKLEIDLDSHDSIQESQGKGVCGDQSITETDEASTLELAKAFKSHNPFFIVVMYPSYVSGYVMSLPKVFAETHITKSKSDVVLQVADGRTWQVRCSLSSSCARFVSGWNPFARDNHLVTGDVCVFELINRAKKLLKVVIFRVKEHKMEKSPVTYYSSYKKTRANSICEEATPYGGFCAKEMHESGNASSTKRMKTKHNDELDTDEFKANSIPHDKMKPLKLEIDLDSHDSIQESKGKGVCGDQMVTESRTLESAKAFRSDNPFFMILMRPSYISGFAACFSKAFAERYITEYRDNVVLQVTDKRSWQVECVSNVIYKHLSSARLTCGWNLFARDNHLAVGDVCIFELINRTEKLLKVVIFRVKEHEN